MYILLQKGLSIFLLLLQMKMIKLRKILGLKIMLHLDRALTKINSTLIENAGDLDIVKPMYNLLEYSQNYSMSIRKFMELS